MYLQEAAAHTGVKGSRAMFLGRTEKVFTVGFSRTSDRQYAIWDPSNMGTALAQENIDTGSGLLMPFFDPDSSIIFLAGKVPTTPPPPPPSSALSD